MLTRLLPLVEGFLLDRMLHSGMFVSRRSKAGIVLLIMAGLLSLVALLFVIVAGYQWALAHFTADKAALLTALFILAVAAALTAGALHLLHRRQSRFKEMKQELTQQLTSLYDAVAEEMDDPVRNHPKTTVALATLAGFLLANRVL